MGELRLTSSQAREREGAGGRREKVRGKGKGKTNFKIKFSKNYDFVTMFFERQLSHHNSDLGVPYIH